MSTGFNFISNLAQLSRIDQLVKSFSDPNFYLSPPVTPTLIPFDSRESKKLDQPTKRYWPVPPMLNSGYIYEYQDVNKDMNLRNEITDFFQKKIIKWINMPEEYPGYAHLQDKKAFYETTPGRHEIYNLLRNYIKRSGINWYDLRDNYTIIKDYLSKKL
jgi:hypothetical protein